MIQAAWSAIRQDRELRAFKLGLPEKPPRQGREHRDRRGGAKTKCGFMRY